MIYTMKQYDMQDDLTRRQVFWLLQRLTSYALWKRKRDAFATFANEYEVAVNTWPEDDPEYMPADNLSTIYEILSLYDKGLEQLARGYRFIWKDGQPLKLAVNRYYHLCQYFFPHPSYWERGAQQAPYPPKVDRLARLMRASEFQMEHAPFEVAASNDNFAQLQSATLLLDPDRYTYQFYELDYPVFPPTLPQVPPPQGPVIESGDEVTVDGIWEPVKISRGKVLGLLSVGEKTEENNGCFNYLVKGTPAPNIKGRPDPRTLQSAVTSTHWRLLWEDTRYKDGVIPDESQYFLVAQHRDAPADEGAAHEEPEAEIEVRTGDICPVTGTWEATDFDNHRIEALQGMVMPDVLASAAGSGERRVHWVTWRLVRRG
ncbi:MULTISPECIES: Imm72 family immunity protein [Paraburkholderia]|uniref:Imm72 family immunity protein n=1 Tax=Paraburkholderia TaxID=1822464 RepID=UPI000BEF27B1|nr:MULTISPECIES: Imm72 family immunity protein [Paraburkholderia]AUT54881.1 hypothetical protein C2L66_24065 [Paraburkholderia caribensis]